MQDIKYRIQETGIRMKDIKYTSKNQDARCKIQEMGNRMQDIKYRKQKIGCKI